MTTTLIHFIAVTQTIPDFSSLFLFTSGGVGNFLVLEHVSSVQERGVARLNSLKQDHFPRYITKYVNQFRS